MKIEIIPSAENDIKDIYNYFKHVLKLPESADKFLSGIRQEINSLKVFPNRGAYHGEKYRKIFYKKFTIVYQIVDDKILIIAIQ